MSSSDNKPSGGPGSVFAFLFPPETRARANEEYQRALEQAQAEDQERQEGEPKCWIN